MEAGANDRLSKAASAIWRMRTAEPDPMGDPSGDCGDLIANYHRSQEVIAVLAAGFCSPGEYNSELKARMGIDGGLFPGRAGYLLMMLEIEHVCPTCGDGLRVKRQYTPNYGGGYDTFESCSGCSYAEVYV